MRQRRKTSRNLCAEILHLSWAGGDGRYRTETVTLHDISAMGACLQLECSIPPGTEVTLHYPNGKYEGKVKYCKYDETECWIGIGFNEGYRWSKEEFTPSHLLELPQALAEAHYIAVQSR